jgi:hypothetical protein
MVIANVLRIAWAIAPPDDAERREVYLRSWLLLTLLGLLVLGTFLIALIWFAVRYWQYTRARDSSHFGPSGRIGPSDWDPSPLETADRNQPNSSEPPDISDETHKEDDSHNGDDDHPGAGGHNDE